MKKNINYLIRKLGGVGNCGRKQVRFHNQRKKYYCFFCDAEYDVKEVAKRHQQLGYRKFARIVLEKKQTP